MKRSDISKEKILKAAEEEFSEKGLHGARVDNIARSAGINKRMLYAYFGNKEDLYSATLNTVYGRLASVEKEIAGIDDPEEAIRCYIDTYFEFLYGNPSFVKLIMWENLNNGKFIETAGAAVLKSASVSNLKKIFEKGKKTGVFKSSINDEELIFAINMFCFSYFSNKYTMPVVINVHDSGSLLKQRAKFVADILIDRMKKN